MSYEVELTEATRLFCLHEPEITPDLRPTLLDRAYDSTHAYVATWEEIRK